MFVLILPAFGPEKVSDNLGILQILIIKDQLCVEVMVALNSNIQTLHHHLLPSLLVCLQNRASKVLGITLHCT